MTNSKELFRLAAPTLLLFVLNTSAVRAQTADTSSSANAPVVTGISNPVANQAQRLTEAQTATAATGSQSTQSVVPLNVADIDNLVNTSQALIQTVQPGCKSPDCLGTLIDLKRQIAYWQQLKATATTSQSNLQEINSSVQSSLQLLQEALKEDHQSQPNEAPDAAPAETPALDAIAQGNSPAASGDGCTPNTPDCVTDCQNGVRDIYHSNIAACKTLQNTFLWKAGAIVAGVVTCFYLGPEATTLAGKICTPLLSLAGTYACEAAATALYAGAYGEGCNEACNGTIPNP